MNSTNIAKIGVNSTKTAKTAVKKMCKSTKTSEIWEKTGNSNSQVFEKAISSFQLAIHSKETFLRTVLLQCQDRLKLLSKPS